MIEVRVIRRGGVALSELLGGAELSREASGKPVLAEGGMHFNLSHSGDVTLLAISPDGVVGIDVERPRRFRNPSGLAARLCSPRELEFVRGGEDELGLLRLWVRKEAVAKADGAGMLMAVGGLDVLDPVVGGEWLVHDLPAPAPGYLAALAWRADR